MSSSSAECQAILQEIGEFNSNKITTTDQLKNAYVLLGKFIMCKLGTTLTQEAITKTSTNSYNYDLTKSISENINNIIQFDYYVEAKQVLENEIKSNTDTDINTLYNNIQNAMDTFKGTSTSVSDENVANPQVLTPEEPSIITSQSEDQQAAALAQEQAAAQPEVIGSVAPPVQAESVAPPEVIGSVAPPVQAVAQPEVIGSVAQPVQPEVIGSVAPPVQAEVIGSVAPPVQAVAQPEVIGSVAQPVQPEVIGSVAPPVQSESAQEVQEEQNLKADQNKLQVLTGEIQVQPIEPFQPEKEKAVLKQFEEQEKLAADKTNPTGGRRKNKTKKSKPKKNKTKKNKTKNKKYSNKYMSRHKNSRKKRMRKSYRGGGFDASQWAGKIAGNNIQQQIDNVSPGGGFANPQNYSVASQFQGGTVGAALATAATPAALWASQYLYGRNKGNIYSKHKSRFSHKKSKKRRQ